MATPNVLYDIKTLLDAGEKLFPEELGTKCPEAIPDVKEGAKCLVYEVYTASAFHFHRANEHVVVSYMKFQGLTIPGDPNFGRYIRALKSTGNTPSDLTKALDIAKSYRNPIMHGESYVYTPDEAVNLFTVVRKTIGLIVREMAKSRKD